MTPAERKAWNAAIEAAARECERLADDWRVVGAGICAKHIRSLTKPEESET